MRDIKRFIFSQNFSLTADIKILKFFCSRFHSSEISKNEIIVEMKLFCAFIGKIWSVFDRWPQFSQGFASAQSGDTASLDCFTDNGGCSHFCRSDACLCPPCWTLDADGFTCVPDPSHVTTTCGPSGMSIDVDECVYNGDTMTLTLNDGVCEGKGSLILIPWSSTE